jgi:bacteriocin-like protein
MQELTMQELETVSGGGSFTLTTFASRATSSSLVVAKDPGDRN